MVTYIKSYDNLLKFFAVTLFLFVSSFVSQPVGASAPGNLQSPFDVGSKWHICQGYDNIGGTHSGSSRLGLDLAGGPSCDNSASGRNLRSPQNGTVSWYSQNSGSLCISTTSGVSVMLTHIDSTLSGGDEVTTGQIVGTIAAPGNKQNNGVAHLHMQAWSTPNCSNNTDQIPFSTIHNARICGAPDMASFGPNPFNTGTWGGTYFVAQTCNQEIPVESAGVERFYAPSLRRHLYTSDVNEANILRTRAKATWNYEGLAYWVKGTSSCPANESVYRFYSELLRVHLYTNDENEKNVLSSYPPEVWRYEGVAYCAERSSTAVTRPIYRLYSEQLKVHLFTADENEKNVLSGYPPEVWRYEGIAYHAYAD